MRTERLKSSFLIFVKSSPLAISIILIVAMALILRLYRIGFCEFWYDEIFSMKIAQFPWNSWNPPLYFILLHFWIKLFGNSEVAVRMLSMIFSVLSVPCLFFLGKKIFNFRVGLIAALIMSISPFHIWYAQEARPYSLGLFLSILSTYLLYLALIVKKRVFWLAFVICSILGIYSNLNYYHFFLLLGQLVFMAIFFKNNLSGRIIYFLLILISILPRLPEFIEKLVYVKGGFWIEPVRIISLLITAENFNLGYNVPFIAYFLSDILVFMLICSSIILVKRMHIFVRGFIMQIILFILPIVAIWLTSKIFIPIYLDRGLIIFSPYYYLILALGFEGLSKARWRVPFIIFFIALIILSIVGYYQNWLPTPTKHHVGVHLKKPVKPMIKFIEINFEPGDAIIHTHSSSQETVKYYCQNKITQHFIFAPGEIDGSWGRPYNSSYGISVKDIDSLKANRLWVISGAWERDGTMDGNSLSVKQVLDSKYRLDFSKEFNGLWLFRYIKN